MAVEEINGETRYTEEAAQVMFSQLKSQYSSNKDDDKKKNTNKRGGTSDKYGDGGKVKYNGSAWFGTNFIGPGPNVDPNELNLQPKDMVDQAAFEHDYSYYLYKASGIKGAVLDLKVLAADEKLAKDALNVIKQYKKGGIDPITGEKISERTANVARLVYAAFVAIKNEKGLRNVVPSTGDNMRTGFNGFINSLNSAISSIK